MEPTKKSHGALIGSVIVIVILVLGGIYYYMSKIETLPNESSNLSEDTSGVANSEQSAAALQSLNQLEADINAEEQSDFAASANDVN